MLGALIYDANIDMKNFELANSGNNVAPVFSNFQVGTSTTLGGFATFAANQHTDNWIGNNSMQGWAFQNGFSVPAVVVNTSNSTQDLGLAPSQILMHPGADPGDQTYPVGYAVLRFTATNAGFYSIIGNWESLDTGSTINYILRNGTSIFKDTSDSFANFNLTEYLGLNDNIDFVVTSNGFFLNDSTGLRASISSVPEPSTLTLFGLGGIALAGIAKRRRAQKVA